MKRDHRVVQGQQGTAKILIEEGTADGLDGQNIPACRMSFFLKEGAFTEAIAQRVRKETGYGSISNNRRVSELCLFQPRNGFVQRTRQVMRILEEELPGVTFVTYSTMTKSLLRDAVTQIKRSEW